MNNVGGPAFGCHICDQRIAELVREGVHSTVAKSHVRACVRNYELPRGMRSQVPTHAQAAAEYSKGQAKNLPTIAANLKRNTLNGTYKYLLVSSSQFDKLA